MTNSVIHPLTVHIPLALPVFLPAIIAYTWWRVRRSQDHHTWNFALLTYGLLLASGLAAFVTGQQDAFNSAVNADNLLLHEHAAKYFLVTCSVGLFLVATLRWGQKPLANTLVLPLMLQSLAQLALAIWVGHIGGDLVFH